MPAPDEEDISKLPCGPSVSLQLHHEFGVFRSTMLNDMKSLLQAALQEVLDQHELLIRQQESNITALIEKTAGQPVDSFLAEGLPPPLPKPEVAIMDAPVMVVGPDTAPPVYPLQADDAVPEFQNKKGSRASVRQRKADRPVMAETQQTKFVKSGLAQGGVQETKLFGNRKILKDAPLDADAYAVADYYKQTGFIANIVRGDIFNNLTLFMICVNSIYIGIDADNNKAPTIDKADVGFIICENIFCAFFTLELILRFGAFAVKSNCLRDACFKFDALLVVVMVLETWLVPLLSGVTGLDMSKLDAGPLRLLRLLRLARISRLMRALPEMVTMIKGMIIATRAVISALLMLVLLIYIFAIIMHSFLKDEGMLAEYFSSVPKSMWTLLLDGVLLSSVGFVVRTMVETGDSVPLCCFMIFVLLSAFTVLNMLVGILCEVVSEVARAEKDCNARAKVRKTLLVMLKNLDSDGSGDISKDELLGVLADPEAVTTLEDLSVDVQYFLNLQNMLYDGEGAVLSIAQIMQLIMEHRGERTATMQDLVNSHTFARWEIVTAVERQTVMLKKYMFELFSSMRQQQPSSFSAPGRTASNPVLGTLQSWYSAASGK